MPQTVDAAEQPALRWALSPCPAGIDSRQGCLRHRGHLGSGGLSCFTIFADNCPSSGAFWPQLRAQRLLLAQFALCNEAIQGELGLLGNQAIQPVTGLKNR